MQWKRLREPVVIIPLGYVITLGAFLAPSYQRQVKASLKDTLTNDVQHAQQVTGALERRLNDSRIPIEHRARAAPYVQSADSSFRSLAERLQRPSTDSISTYQAEALQACDNARRAERLLQDTIYSGCATRSGL